MAKADQGSTKVIGPIVDNKDCPVGWCDPKDAQMSAPKGWGNAGIARSSPKTDHRGE